MEERRGGRTRPPPEGPWDYYVMFGLQIFFPSRLVAVFFFSADFAFFVRFRSFLFDFVFFCSILSVFASFC